MTLLPLFAVSIYWHLPVMIVIISLVYSATRYDDWSDILQESGRWAVRMVAFLGGIGLVLFLLSLVVSN